MDNPQQIDIIRKNYPKYRSFKKYIQICNRHINSGVAHYESIGASAQYLTNSVNIVPKYNLIKNTGVDTKESTHSTDDIRTLPKRTQKLFYKKTFEIDFPLTHPEKIEINKKFERKMTPTKLQVFFDKIEHYFRIFVYKGLKEFFLRASKKK